MDRHSYIQRTSARASVYDTEFTDMYTMRQLSELVNQNPMRLSNVALSDSDSPLSRIRTVS